MQADHVDNDYVGDFHEEGTEVVACQAMEESDDDDRMHENDDADNDEQDSNKDDHIINSFGHNDGVNVKQNKYEEIQGDDGRVQTPPLSRIIYSQKPCDDRVPSSLPLAPKTDDSLSQIVAMGFEEHQAREALTACYGNTERAIDYLLGTFSSDNATNVAGSTLIAPAGTSNSSVMSIPSMVSCDVSQYSLEHGRSACTCIALTGAASFLRHADQEITSEMIRDIVVSGVFTYQRLARYQQVEHMSAEDIMTQSVPEFHGLQMVGTMARQGILSHDPNHPLGLRTMLQGCRNDVTTMTNTTGQWMAVLLTKTPETVVLFLPPTLSEKFVLLDSHPRWQFSADHAYARIHSHFDDLVQSLECIFPPTELGPDIPEMMAIMYNSFDLYPFILSHR